MPGPRDTRFRATTQTLIEDLNLLCRKSQNIPNEALDLLQREVSRLNDAIEIVKTSQGIRAIAKVAR